MGKNSNIDWTDHTWNPWQGCQKVSPGCTNCYMYRDKKRFGQDPSTVVKSKPATFNKPLHWKDPAKVFVCSWSDFFIEDADEWRDEAWRIMQKTPHLTYQLLTKRPENILDRLPECWPLPNVWLGVTVESQRQDGRINTLLSIPAAGHFISVEPMVGPVALLPPWLRKLDWVICGGESGPEARNMDPYWAEDLKLECLAGGIPFFMKQMSGSGKAQREAIPEYLNVREFPRGL